jgi:hypothetical protein
MNQWQGKEFIFILNHPKRYIKGKVLSVALNFSCILFTEGKTIGFTRDDILGYGEDESELLYKKGTPDQVALQENPDKMELILLHAIQNNNPPLVEYISNLCNLSFIYKHGTAIELAIGSPIFDILIHKRAAFSQKYFLKRAIDTYDYPLNMFNVSQITDMSQMFKNFVFEDDISSWDVSNVENMREMFANSTFQGDISKWDVSNVKDMSGMFFKTEFQGDLSEWDVSNVLYMIAMFRSSSFQGDVSTWDISSVKDMREMFANSEYTRDLSTWNTFGKHVENMFNRCPIREEYKPIHVKPTFDCVALIIGHSDFNADTPDYKEVPEGCTITTILADKPQQYCYANTSEVIPFVTKMFHEKDYFDKSPQKIRDKLYLLDHKGAISKTRTRYYNREWEFYVEDDVEEYGCVLIFTRERIHSLYQKEIRTGTFILSKEKLLQELFKTYKHPLLLDFGCSRVNGSKESVQSFKKKGIYGGSRRTRKLF